MKYCWEQRIEDAYIGNDKHISYLILGHGAKRELKALYDKVSSLNYDANWIDGKDEVSFWIRALKSGRK